MKPKSPYEYFTASKRQIIQAKHENCQDAELNKDGANSTQKCSKLLPIPQFDRIADLKRITLALMSSSETETDLMEVEKRTEENRKVTFNPCYRHFYNACFDVHRDVNSTQFILEQFWAHLIYW